jgi:aryl-alcohol dehydrogenase-like predicted oxidoreductase
VAVAGRHGHIYHELAIGDMVEYHDSGLPTWDLARSLRGTSVISLDLLQFHWWDYNNPYYMDTLKYLSDLRDKGIIKHIGLKF